MQKKLGGKVDSLKADAKVDVYCQYLYEEQFSFGGKTYDNFLEFCFAQGRNGTQGGEPSSSKGVQKFLKIAKEIHDFVANPNISWTYRSNSHVMSKYYEPRFRSGSGGEIDCSSYVNWVIYRYTNYQCAASEENTYPGGLDTKANQGYFKQFGFETIKPSSGKYLKQSDVKAGDILICKARPNVPEGKWNGGHTEIYIGNGKSYSCGNNRAIKAKDGSTTNFDTNYTTALRLTN